MVGLLKLMIGEEPRSSDPALQEDLDERASAGYYLIAARPNLRCLNIDAGEGAVRVVLEREVVEDVASVVLDAVQRRTTTPTTNNEVSVGVTVRILDVGASRFFHIGEQGEQGDASAKVGAELHPLDYWVLDTGAAWTMTPRKELLEDVRAAPINEVCSASGHALKVAGTRRAAFKGADAMPVVLHDILLVPDLKANLISLRKLAKAGVSTSTDGARTYKGQLGNRVLWDLHESKDLYRSMWR
ncbi:unnamed protein product [Closterium sp. NIES-54]